MKISLNWLKEYIDVNMPPLQIAKILTSAGLEVDSVESKTPGFEGIVVAKVTEVQPHPNADTLVLATVFDGSTTSQVVCGAPNCRKGIKTAFAPVGATLKDENGNIFKIKKAKLRGVESHGMLCSGLELGISDDPSGIIEFADHLKEGIDVAGIYADTIFEISLTPNLAHCLSVIGIARELSAMTGLPIKLPAIVINETPHDNINKHVRIVVGDQVKCPRYACRLIKDVVIKPSPDWLKKRLEAVGLRPINNIVDSTNYVLLEFGQPLHAFDFDRLEGREVHIRTAKEGETIVSLDEKTRLLDESDLVICDKKQPIAVAGVIGGLDSAVSAQTNHVLIESAYFHPGTIRQTSKKLGLQTDASKRFERGCDPNAVLQGLDRVAMLIQELAGGTISEGYIDIKEKEFPEKIIDCRLSKLNSLLGTHLGVSEIESIIQRSQCSCHWKGEDTFTVTVPTYRVDIQAEIDLVEEVARIYGYDNIPKAAARYTPSNFPHSPIFLFERDVRARLLTEGLQEFLTCDLIGPTLLNIIQDTSLPEESFVKVINPTSIEQSILRTSMLPGLLQVIKHNYDHQNHSISGFEIGRIHFKQGDQYIEQAVAGIVLTGKNHPHHWNQKNSDVDFYDLKGILESVLQELNISEICFKQNNFNIFHPGRQASIYVGSLKIGSLGEVHPSIQRRLDIPQRIYFAEVNLHDLIQIRSPDKKMKPIPIYPSSERDWTVTLPESTPINEVLTTIRSIPSGLLENVSILDLYRSDKLGKDKKNATFRFVYRDKEGTILQESVDNEHKKIVDTALLNI
jgi:phenylalanyl-tRNA synthetase beta chain